MIPTQTAVPTTVGPAPDVGAPARRYRPELQGLRAVAALLVVLYHVWLDRISGGVDVFFLISGFLITGQLHRASSRGGIRFGPMWGRMIKRLFPAALTVLLGVMAASVAFLPESRWLQTIREVVASALYMENWQLAADSVDYFAQHDSASVVQHFWSLSIQGQFYVVWPLLIALVALLARTVRRDLRATLLITLAGLFVASLAYSVLLTAQNQPLAYFHSLTRVWEFALGGLLALTIDRIVLPRLLRIALGWLGVAGLVSCGLVLQIGTVFPGYAALWPTMSALLVILAGATDSGAGADRWLSSRPLEYLGNTSYALYLWHWPVLLFYLIVRDREEIGLRGGGFVIVVSILLAVLTYHLVENPLRTSNIGVRASRGAYQFGVIALVPVLLLAGTWQLAAAERANTGVLAVGDPDHPGALAQLPGFRYQGAEDVDPVPSYVALSDDWGGINSDNCETSRRNEDLNVCTYRVTDRPVRRIVLIGDSHMGQYLGALKPLAERRNWEIKGMFKGACPFSTDADAMPGDPGCIRWNADAAAEIEELQPDAVLTLATRNVKPGRKEYTPEGFVEQWQRMNEAGIPVLAVRDNPRHDINPPDCAQAHGADDPRCASPRAEFFGPVAPYEELANVPPNVSFLDFTDIFCADRVCPAMIGNVLVYIDGHHISATFMETMSPVLEQRIDAAMGW